MFAIIRLTALSAEAKELYDKLYEQIQSDNGVVYEGGHEPVIIILD